MIDLTKGQIADELLRVHDKLTIVAEKARRFDASGPDTGANMATIAQAQLCLRTMAGDLRDEEDWQGIRVRVRRLLEGRADDPTQRVEELLEQLEAGMEG